MTSSVLDLTLAGAGPVGLTVDDRGEGRPFLLLHGGGGPQTVAGFAELLATKGPARVITPTHPGFGGTPRPDGLAGMPGLAALYRELLDRLGLDGVTVIGNSIGGWIAAELALLASPRICGTVLVDAVGIEVDGHPVTDISPLSLDELARLSYHDPAAFRIDPAAMTEAQRAGMAANRATLQVYAGTRMGDPALRGRLAAVASPVLVIWGDADRIADPDYGRAYAAAIPGARFELLTETGHLPQLETPEKLLRAVWGLRRSTRRPLAPWPLPRCPAARARAAPEPGSRPRMNAAPGALGPSCRPGKPSHPAVTCGRSPAGPFRRRTWTRYSRPVAGRRPHRTGSRGTSSWSPTATSSANSRAPAPGPVTRPARRRPSW
jgi:pimeloyl-ACP methyl ester carboxylesterase